MPEIIKSGFSVFNGLAPIPPSDTGGGPRALPVAFDFSSVATKTHNLMLEEAQGIIGFVQSLWADNADNPNPLTITFQGTNQRIVVPANAQGLYPVLATNPTVFTLASTVNALAIGQIILLNVPMPLVESGPVFAVPLITGIFTDRSGTIAVGATSQTLAAANASRQMLIVQNPNSASESLYINFGAAATIDNDSLEIVPGATFDTGTGPLSLEEVTVIATTLGHKFIAKEM